MITYDVTNLSPTKHSLFLGFKKKKWNQYMKEEGTKTLKSE